MTANEVAANVAANITSPSTALSPLEPDLNEIKHHLALIKERGRVDFRFLHSDHGRSENWSGWLEKPGAIADEISWRNKRRWNTYFCVNGLKDDAQDRTKESFAELRFCAVDIDRDKTGNESHHEARDRLTDLAEALQGTAAEPSLALWTGGGIQLFWRLPDIAATTEAMQEVERANIDLKTALGGDDVQDITRILRVAGTVNWLSKAKRAEGRQPELVRVLYDSRRRFELGDLPELVGAVRDITEPTGLVRHRNYAQTSTRLSAPRRTKAAKPWTGHRFVSTEDAIHLLDLIDPEADGVHDRVDWQPVIANILMLTNGDPDVVKRLEDWHYGRVTAADNAIEVGKILTNWRAHGWDTPPDKAAWILAEKVVGCAAESRLKEAEQMAAFLRSIKLSIEFLPDDDGRADYAQLPVPSFAAYVAARAEKAAEEAKAETQHEEASNPDEPNWLIEMNKHYAVVKGNDRIAEFADNGDVTFMSDKAFKLWHTKTVPVTNAGGRIDQRPMAAAWLQHPGRRGYKAIGVWPVGKEPEGAYNQFRGLTVEPAEGAWPQTREFIRDVICSGDPALNEFVLNWIADFLRQPTRKSYTALALVGDEGIGKSFFGKVLLGEYLHRSNWFEPTDKKHLVGNFNAHLLNKVQQPGRGA
jgi:hypothetical protein